MVAREREVENSLQAEFKKTLAVKLSEKEEAVTAALNAKHAREIEALEAKWATKLEAKEDELLKQKSTIAEVRATGTFPFDCCLPVLHYILKQLNKQSTFLCSHAWVAHTL